MTTVLGGGVLIQYKVLSVQFFIGPNQGRSEGVCEEGRGGGVE